MDKTNVTSSNIRSGDNPKPNTNNTSIKKLTSKSENKVEICHMCGTDTRGYLHDKIPWNSNYICESCIEYRTIQELREEANSYYEDMEYYRDYTDDKDY